MSNDKCCKDCKDRTVEPNCHMTCEKYSELIRKQKEINEQRKMDSALTGLSNMTSKWFIR